jgi:hypothetical protein
VYKVCQGLYSDCCMLLKWLNASFEAGGFSLLQCPDRLWSPQASCSVCTGVKWLVHEIDHSPPPSTADGIEWSCNCTSMCTFTLCTETTPRLWRCRPKQQSMCQRYWLKPLATLQGVHLRRIIHCFLFVHVHPPINVTSCISLNLFVMCTASLNFVCFEMCTYFPWVMSVIIFPTSWM